MKIGLEIEILAQDEVVHYGATTHDGSYTLDYYEERLEVGHLKTMLDKILFFEDRVIQRVGRSLSLTALCHAYSMSYTLSSSFEYAEAMPVISDQGVPGGPELQGARHRPGATGLQPYVHRLRQGEVRISPDRASPSMDILLYMPSVRVLAYCVPCVML